MSVIKTLKHEMSYDTETKQAIFNDRNKTRLAPTQEPFSPRMLSVEQGSDIEGNTINLGPSDNVDDATIEMSSGSIEEHTLNL